MTIKELENLMYYLSDFFLAPVLLLLVLLFAYSLFALGVFSCQFLQRRRNQANYFKAIGGSDNSVISTHALKGYPLTEMVCAFQKTQNAEEMAKGSFLLTKDRLDVAALKELEGVRNVSRLAPMLGLIATMVPMGPALKSLADGDVQGISDNLIVAFSAVIFGLVIASITFWIASVKKRWLATELVDLQPLLDKATAYYSDNKASDSKEGNREAA